MKNLLFILCIYFSMAACSCKKTTDKTSYSLDLLQHKWMAVFTNDEALKYVGTPVDYYRFSTDDFLYIYLNNNYDTIATCYLPIQEHCLSTRSPWCEDKYCDKLPYQTTR